MTRNKNAWNKKDICGSAALILIFKKKKKKKDVHRPAVLTEVMRNQPSVVLL